MTEHIFRLESTYAELPPVFFNKLSPTPVSQPNLVIFNDKLADEMGLNLSTMGEKDRIKLPFREPDPGWCRTLCPSLCRPSIWKFHHAGRRASHCPW